MMVSHFNVVLINRAMDTYRGRMVPVMKRIHPMSVVDITRNVDDMIDQQVKVLSQGQINHTTSSPRLNTFWAIRGKISSTLPT